MSSPTADLRGPAGLGHEAEDLDRRRRLLQRWRRHSILIKVLRRLLPVLSAAILLAIAGWSVTNVLFARGDGAKVKTNSEIRMTNFHLQGRTEKGQPYLVTAASAVRDTADNAKLTLDKPMLDVGVGTPEWTSIKAGKGIYRQDTGMLDLSGQVTLDDYQGNHLDTEHALVDTKKNNADGDTPISGGGPLGSIHASSYSLRDGGAYVLFSGGVKSHIEQRKTTAAPPARH